MFALEKASNSLRPIVIGSLWRRCVARLGVAEVRSNVATFFMSQYTNFIQFGGESDGATRCAQVTQLLAAAWVQHSEENPLVVIQLDIINAYSSADWQAHFDELAGRASKSYDNGHVHMGDGIQGQAHKIACSKDGQQDNAFETVRFVQVLRQWACAHGRWHPGSGS